MNSKERVKRAIEFKNPDCIPCDRGPDSDVATLGYVWRQIAKTATTYTTEWGFVVRPEKPCGYHVDYSPLTDWKDYPQYRFPDVKEAHKVMQDNYDNLIKTNPSYFKDKYTMGHESGGPYLFMGMIRGQENFFMDLLAEKEKIGDLFDRVADYFIGLFRKWKELGADGVLCHEDWGSSHGLIMSPASFRAIFIPRYKRMKKAANEMGIHFGIQATGDVLQILPDLIDMKLDFFAHPELNVMGIKKMAEIIKGKLFLWTAADWKSTLTLETPENVKKEVKEIIDNLSTPQGGLGFWLGKSASSDCRPENVQAQEDAFRQWRHVRR